jgi:indole-3-glycerol phosphate synthase
MSRLDDLVSAAREDVERRKAHTPVEDLRSQIGTSGGARPFSEALVRPGLSLIAEFKRRSPSAGDIGDSEVAETVAAYERGGAAALSVLTDGPHFGGSLDDLRQARHASGLPILRKDFIVDVYQLYEAAVNGADAVLLIVGALGNSELELLYGEARAIDLDCLVEVHDEDELERALEVVDADVIGINNRNLADLSVDAERTKELITDVPAGKTVVSESGYSQSEQLDELERIGVDAVLIGEALMRSGDPEAAVRELTRDEEATREHYFQRASEE